MVNFKKKNRGLRLLQVPTIFFIEIYWSNLVQCLFYRAKVGVDGVSRPWSLEF